MVILLGVLGLLILAAIPSKETLGWLLIQDQENYQKGTPIPAVYFAKTPYVALGSLGLDFLKGFGGLWLINQLLGIDSWLTLIFLPLFLLAHHRSFFLGLKTQSSLIMVIAGAYCFMEWPIGLIFFPGFLIMSLLLNSFLTGLIGVVLFQFWPIWSSEIDPMFFLFNFMIFITLVFVYHRELFHHFEEKPRTILQSYIHR